MYRAFMVLSITVLACFLVLSPLNIASAQVLPEFFLPDGQAEPGESIPLNLGFDNNGQVGSLNITINYNPNVVRVNQFTPVVPGPAIINLPVFNLSFNAVVPGELVILLDLGPFPVNPIPDGDIVTINFLVQNNAQVGEMSSLDITVNTLVNTAGNFIVPPDADIFDGSITVISEPPEFIDVVINKSANTNRIDPGIPTLINYTVTLEGVGDPGAQATAVEVTDALPSGASFQADISSPECEMLQGPPNSVSCDVSTVTDGEVVILDIAVSVIGQEGADLLNQAIVDFLDEVGNPTQNDSNTVTLRIRSRGGGGGGGGCTLAGSSTVSSDKGLLNLGILLVPAVIALFRVRRRMKS